MRCSVETERAGGRRAWTRRRRGERAALLDADQADVRGEVEARFWIGIVHQVIRREQDAAVLQFEQSNALAEQAGDLLTRSYALRHLGIAHVAGGLGEARTLASAPEAAGVRRRVEEASADLGVP